MAGYVENLRIINTHCNTNCNTLSNRNQEWSWITCILISGGSFIDVTLIIHIRVIPSSCVCVARYVRLVISSTVSHALTYTEILRSSTSVCCATYCNMLQRTATRCNMLQHAATCCNMLAWWFGGWVQLVDCKWSYKRFEHIELAAKLLKHFLRSNESNINQYIFTYVFIHTYGK